MMFLSSTKEIYSSRKSNNHLVKKTEKTEKLTLSKTDGFGELQLKQISLNFKTFWLQLKIRSLGAKLCKAFQLF